MARDKHGLAAEDERVKAHMERVVSKAEELKVELDEMMSLLQDGVAGALDGTQTVLDSHVAADTRLVARTRRKVLQEALHAIARVPDGTSDDPGAREWAEGRMSAFEAVRRLLE